MTTSLCIGPRCGGQEGPREADTGRLICAGCTSRLRRDIGITPTLQRWLGHHLAPGAGAGPKVSGSRDAPVPVRIDVIDHQARIGDVLKSWVWLIAEHRGLTYPAVTTVDEVAPWLERHVDWATTRPWIDDMCAELDELRRVAHRLAPWRVHVVELDGPCPSCDLRALIRTSGETYIECDVRVGGCSALWTDDEYLAKVTSMVEVESQ
ncbi:hypothetical protein ACIBKY_51315 [Nonomuraea sp. NPDC050394]|uniref:hypothetical protein n=1 Tax=Nonomuraea sp. NPDC050394 TaxID=3364363 RepID=UPI00379BF5F9